MTVHLLPKPVQCVLFATALWAGGSGFCAFGQAEAPANERPAIAPDHPLVPALKLAYEAREAVDQVQDYTCTFFKSELVDGQIVRQTIRMKVRREPFSVYMKFQAPHAGREVLFVEGVRNNQLLAHEEGLKGLVGTISLQPQSEPAMVENRYPITRIGIHNLVESVISQWEAEGQYGEIDVKYYPQAKIGETPCKAIETSHPQQRKQFAFQKTRLYLDIETNLPIAVEQYAWPTTPDGKPVLVEFYHYQQLQPNAKLTNADFDPKNPAYRF